MRKLGSPQKARRKKSKPGVEMLIKNLRKQAKMIKQEKDAGICRNKKEKATQEKIQLEEINQKLPAKGGRLKRYRQRVKQYRQNQTFQSNKRKFYQQLGRDGMKTYQQPDAKETERFRTEIWQKKQKKKHNDKANA